MIYDSIIVGGGIAGLQAAIQLGRMRHKVVVIDSGDGRSTLCRSYHNVLGWPDGVSGPELRRIGRLQAESYGVAFFEGEAVDAVHEGEHIAVRTGGNPPALHHGLTLLIATGVRDRFPDFPGLIPCLGKTVYVCPDCDGYEVAERRTIIIGSGHAAAGMALTLAYFTDRIVCVNHELMPIGDDMRLKLNDAAIEWIEAPISEIAASGDGQFHGVHLADGRTVQGDRGFIAFGGNSVKSDWTAGLGVERLENKHIVTDPRTKATSAKRVWAAGDVGVHSEQLTIAMGEGSQAAIWMHKELLTLKQAGKHLQHV